MSTEVFKEALRKDKVHFAKCLECGEMIDRRRLSEVVWHMTHEGPPPDEREGMVGRMIKSPRPSFGAWKEQYGISTIKVNGSWVAEMDPADTISSGPHLGKSEYAACAALAKSESLPAVPKSG